LSAPARTPAGTVAASRRGLILVSAVALLGAAVLTGLLLWSNGGDGTPKVVPNSLVKLDPNTVRSSTSSRWAVNPSRWPWSAMPSGSPTMKTQR
jgi:hypothetical protein